MERIQYSASEMDPVTAVGLVASVVQLIDVTLKGRALSKRLAAALKYISLSML